MISDKGAEQEDSTGGGVGSEGRGGGRGSHGGAATEAGEEAGLVGRA